MEVPIAIVFAWPQPGRDQVVEDPIPNEESLLNAMIKQRFKSMYQQCKCHPSMSALERTDRLSEDTTPKGAMAWMDKPRRALYAHGYGSGNVGASAPNTWRNRQLAGQGLIGRVRQDEAAERYSPH